MYAPDSPLLFHFPSRTRIIQLGFFAFTRWADQERASHTSLAIACISNSLCQCVELATSKVPLSFESIFDNFPLGPKVPSDVAHGQLSRRRIQELTISTAQVTFIF